MTMNALQLLSICALLVPSFTFPRSTLQSIKGMEGAMFTRHSRHDSELVDERIECISIVSREGTYWYMSGDSDQVCGLYVIGEPNQFVMLDFKYVDVACIKDGLLGVFDGWELDGQLFPNEEDHPQEFDRRYKTYCGDDKPNKIFISSQNVAMVQHRIPVAGGFSVHVKFVPNPKPCNVIARLPNGHYSLRNWGRALNCSFSMIYPERVRVRELTVGEREYTGVAAQVRRSPILGQSGSSTTRPWSVVVCAKRGMKDYVEFRAGNGLDPKKMGYSFQMCGVATATTKKLEVPLGCGNSVVRLVSSGDFYNSVDFEFAILEPGESMISACTP